MPASDVRILAERYELVEILGHGGMGVVWRARDGVLGREIAVKEVRLPPGLDAGDAALFYQRTLREARAAARLRHPSILSVYDVITEQGCPWIVMELIEGRSLGEVIKQDGPLPPEHAARIGLALASALIAAHGSGIVHRDVKPCNVMLAADERVVLTDFGIAALEGATALTESGALIGSPAYMAPEVARGESATAAADLWSLGATLFSMVEGHPPYQRNTPVATLGALLIEDPPRPRRAGPLAPVIKGLLHKEPNRRLAAGPLIPALQAAVSPPAQAARPGASVQVVARAAARAAACAQAVTRTTAHAIGRTARHGVGQSVRQAAARVVIRPTARPALVGTVTVIITLTMLATLVAWYAWSGRYGNRPSDSTPRSPHQPVIPSMQGASPFGTPGSDRAGHASPAIPLAIRVRKPTRVYVQSMRDRTYTILQNGVLATGDIRHYYDTPLNLVVDDGSACEVIIYGVVQPAVAANVRRAWSVKAR